MKKMLSALVLALVVVAFASCKKDEPVVPKVKTKTLEEKAGDQAKEALKQVPSQEKPKDHPAH